MPIRDLLNHGGDVVDRVSRGESVTVTRRGKPVAELRPVRKRGVSTAELVLRRTRLAPVDPESLRRDVDEVLGSSL